MRGAVAVATVTAAVVAGALWGASAPAGAATISHPAVALNSAETAMPSTLDLDGEMVEGPDGDVWFATDDSASISRIDPSGKITSYFLPSAYAEDEINALQLGTDGDFWFSVEGQTSAIVKMTPTGVFTAYPVGYPDTISGVDFYALRLVPGSNGSFWFLLTDGETVGSITSDGVITTHRVESPANADVEDIAPGIDGSVWFDHADQIGNLSATGKQTMTTIPSHHEATTLQLGRGGVLWFADLNGGVNDTRPLDPRIGHITPSFAISEHDLGPEPDLDGFDGYSMTKTPDGNIWASFDGDIVKATPGGRFSVFHTGLADAKYLVPTPTGQVSFAGGRYGNTHLLSTSIFYTNMFEIDTNGRVTQLSSGGSSHITSDSYSEHDISGDAWDSSGNAWFERAFDETFTKVYPVPTTRIAGADRYATSVAVSKSAYPNGAGTVFVAAGGEYPDALAAAPAAAAAKAPLLLVEQSKVPSEVQAELTRLHPSHIVVVGGTSAVSQAVVTQLGQTAPVQVVAGADRYQTSQLVAQDFFPAGTSTTAFVATGRSYPDALAASAAAGSHDDPVILVPGTWPNIDAATSSTLTGLGITTVDIAGGTAAVSAGIATQLAGVSGVTTVTRLAGSDRYGTAVAIDKAWFPTATTARFATGAGFADALSAAAVSGAQGTPLYIAQPTCVPGEVSDDLLRNGATKAQLIGGTSALGAGVAALQRCP